jgi:hypothetical protein
MSCKLDHSQIVDAKYCPDCGEQLLVTAHTNTATDEIPSGPRSWALQEVAAQKILGNMRTLWGGTWLWALAVAAVAGFAANSILGGVSNALGVQTSNSGIGIAVFFGVLVSYVPLVFIMGALRLIVHSIFIDKERL